MAQSLDQLVSAGAMRPLKDEGRTRAGLLPGPDGAPAFVKCTRAGSWMRGLLATARGSRVKRWLGGARMLGAAGFNRPAPFAALEVRRAGAVAECYLACEALCDARILSSAVFEAGSANPGRRRALLVAVAREVRRLHDAGLYTRDLQETNLMIEERPGAARRIWFVDLEDFRHARGQVSWHRRLTNLIHLDRSLGRFLSRAARMRFLCDYLGGDALGHAERRRVALELLRLRARVENRRRLRGLRPPIAPAVSPSVAGRAGNSGIAVLTSPPASR
jgi:hypothetical protein